MVEEGQSGALAHPLHAGLAWGWQRVLPLSAQLSTSGREGAKPRGRRPAVLVGQKRVSSPGMISIPEPVEFDTCGFTYAANSVYQLSEEVCCDIQDIAHKSLVLHEPPAQLLALFLQGPSTEHAGTAWSPTPHLESQRDSPC